jgi:hypothetical protein
MADGDECSSGPSSHRSNDHEPPHRDHRDRADSQPFRPQQRLGVHQAEQRFARLYRLDGRPGGGPPSRVPDEHRRARRNILCAKRKSCDRHRPDFSSKTGVVLCSLRRRQRRGCRLGDGDNPRQRDRPSQPPRPHRSSHRPLPQQFGSHCLGSIPPQFNLGLLTQSVPWSTADRQQAQTMLLTVASMAIIGPIAGGAGAGGAGLGLGLGGSGAGSRATVTVQMFGNAAGLSQLTNTVH